MIPQCRERDAYLLKVVAKPPFEKLGILIKQCQQERVECNYRVAPALVSSAFVPYLARGKHYIHGLYE